MLKVKDFEGYKVYCATDHNFNEVFGVTDADGRPIQYKPIAQFDLKNGVKGYFRGSAELFQQSHGASFYLVDDTGLQHSFMDYDVENGRRYFYSVVAYDRGDETLDIFPKENDKRMDVLPSGEERTYRNRAVAIPDAAVAGYVPPEGSILVPPLASVGTGSLFYVVVDEQAQTSHTYRLEFLDTGNDGVDNDGDWNVLTDDVGSDSMPNTNDPDGIEGNGLPDRGEPNVDGRDPDEYFVPTPPFTRCEISPG